MARSLVKKATEAAAANAAAGLLFCFRCLRTEQRMQKILSRYWLLVIVRTSPSPIRHHQPHIAGFCHATAGVRTCWTRSEAVHNGAGMLM